MISVENLTVTFSGDDLFKNVTFLIDSRDRIGLVGSNGAGKTTLLRVITGELEPTGGSVSRDSDAKIGYLPQTMKVADDTTLVDECYKAFSEISILEKEIEHCTTEVSSRTDYESPEYETFLKRLHDATERYHLLGGDTRQADVERTLIGLGFKRSEFGNHTSTFSGGWRMRIELAKILLQKPSLLLLDEPTNHLDIESIQWLEEYLKDFNGSVVLISHDRAFLDNITNRTVEISLGKINDYKVPYSKYVELRKERQQQQMAAYENQQKLIEKTEEFIERFRYKPTKSNQVQSRIKQLEKLDIVEIEDEDLSRINIRFPDAPRSGQIVVEGKDLGHRFGEKQVFSGADIVIERGQKVALVGKNGEGKTTFVRLAIHELTPTDGSIKIGHNVNIGYYAQNQEKMLNGELTVFETLDHIAVGDIRRRLRDILGSFLFRGDEIDKKVKVLSGGERARLAMAKLMLEPYNLLILDEPTNHMDMRSKDILKQALQNYNGTVIVISHDREFLDGLVEVVYEFRDGRVRQHLGGIYDYIHTRHQESKKEMGSIVQNITAKQERTVSKGALSYQEQKEIEREENRKRNRRIKIEAEIEKLEMKIAQMEETLHDPAKYSAELLNEYQKTQKELDNMMSKWENLI